ncbi:hypothetical protein A2303_03170 [Candidatus Falkowbacteria bacterium RIFOXYB2_FULL_47_14]|uniref:Uncharacterized protein n=1 Tax=Candidatus Falkowbacteria bacterium RIFOXYA2_FULL_47_19 TaxID=1797994 RepID=A0A1F5SFC7_9BACT|nr:MAG: hypothetical protein A2227_07805 [Candidatus Falkowbacteria bacterium RIFOXYA2_FULL_47_19]OGF35187.1 MAG: hypothetical protein A2468_02005 [Candidatus Falkowbacteria bacterium RIFOXYC2_FULL_46_15]OGF43352.1 MAG: hypothetical protein A2303_03170 [Candidatus Falkowbacteria bacterium RIFOXYB2_FULL_47_14]
MNKPEKLHHKKRLLRTTLILSAFLSLGSAFHMYYCGANLANFILCLLPGLIAFASDTALTMIKNIKTETCG